MSFTAETENIILSPLQKEDAKNSNDENVKAAASRFGGEDQAFAVTAKATLALIGYVAVETGDLSLYITPSARDQGYATEALTLSFDLLFGCAGVQKLTADCACDHQYAIKTLYRVGMEKEKEENGRFYAVLTMSGWERL